MITLCASMVVTVAVALLAVPYVSYDCLAEGRRLMRVGDALTSKIEGAKMFAQYGHPEIALQRGVEVQAEFEVAKRDTEAWKRRCK
jgi:hypothetical protein